MSNFRFANPQWIHSLWFVLAITVALIALELRGRSVLDQLVSRFMQSRLVHRTTLTRRLSAIVLCVASMILLVFAMMRPQWGVSVQETIRVDSQIMICLDVSKSMLAEDVAPNRLDRAKVELDSLLGLMDDGQQVGLTAFAGKAAVLCPMTTDFGFLRLILNETEPDSVGLGGTKIGEAIGKAVEGFRESGDINRMILLITDGEDHDSFPLEAAEKAREKGVKIVSIGFGDESGSKIEITDQETGSRTPLKDRDNNDVVSRLDGDTLRDIASETDGAYVPAGTGALDLESIYRAHIATLLKGSTESQQRVVRNEAFQWLLIAALALFITGLAVSVPVNLKAQAFAASQQFTAPTPSQTATVVLICCLLFPSGISNAQGSPADAIGQAGKTDSAEDATKRSSTQENDEGKKTAKSTAAEEIDDAAPPRDIYNRALAWVKSDPDRAEKYLNRARRDAAVDGELRYRALYNLGWVEVNRANVKLADDPKMALQHLHQAANRFREAVRVRPDSSDARHNLEIISRRILELIDQLNQQDPRDLAARLDELIGRLRQHQGDLQAIVQRSGNEVDKADTQTYRQEFRRLAIAQREIISEMQSLSDDANKEVDALKQKNAEESTPKEKLRISQVDNMLVYLDRSIQRLNKSRSLTRRLQGGRSFRRWASGLNDAKRARDQLRNPVEVLGILVAETAEMAGLTRALALPQANLSEKREVPELPAWLTPDYVRDLHAATAERTVELRKTLASTVSNQMQPQPNSAQAAPAADPRTDQLLVNIGKSLPLIRDAETFFGEAAEELKSESFAPAFRKQNEALVKLSQAWEFFFDIRRLIEVIYGDQQTLKRIVGQVKTQPDVAREMAAALLQSQQKNLERCQRLDKMFDFELEQLQKAAAPAGPVAAAPQPKTGSPAGPDEQTKAQIERLELAKQILALAKTDVEMSQDRLREFAELPASNPTSKPADEGSESDSDTADDNGPKPAGDSVEKPKPTEPRTESAESDPNEVDAQTDSSPAEPRLEQSEQAMQLAIEKIEELRRLFFSLVEHLRDTAQRQADLNDETTQLSAAEADTQTPEKIGPLAGRQEQLQQIAEQIAEALQKQSDQTAAAPQQSASAQAAPNPKDAAQAAEKLAQAAGLVDAAQKSMTTSAVEFKAIDSQKLTQDAPFERVTESQQTALQKLAEALALLDDQNQQQDEPNKDEQNQDQQKDQEEQQKNQQQQQQNMSAQQLLQLIRDREAQRRRDKKKRAAAATGSVDKDW